MDKDLAQSIQEYERNIESGSTFYMDASTLMDIEEYYENNNMRYEAEQLMRFAQKLHPQNDDVNVTQAYRLKSMGKWFESIQTINKVNNRDNTDVKLFWIEFDIASSLLKNAERKIEELLNNINEIEKENLLLDIGEIYLDYGYYDKALKYLQAIPPKFQSRKRVDELIADIYYQTGKYQQSQIAFNNLIDSDPYDAVSWTQLADIQLKNKNFEECILSCDYALALDDSNQQAIQLKLFAMFLIDKYEEGIQLFNFYSSRLPNDYTIRMYMGEQFFTHSDFQEALPHLQDALRLCPLDSADRPRIINDLAYVYANLGEYKHIEEIVTSLCMLGSNIVDIDFQISTIYFECQQEQLAVESLKKILLHNISDKEHIRIAQQLLQYKCFDKAQSLWNQLSNCRLSSDYYDFYAYVSLAMYKLRNPAQLAIHVKQAIDKCPSTLINVFHPIYHINDTLELYNRIIFDSSQWDNN